MVESLSSFLGFPEVLHKKKFEFTICRKDKENDKESEYTQRDLTPGAGRPSPDCSRLITQNREPNSTRGVNPYEKSK